MPQPTSHQPEMEPPYFHRLDGLFKRWYVQVLAKGEPDKLLLLVIKAAALGLVPVGQRF